MQTKELKDIHLFLFDMDGTLFLGNQIFDFTKELLEKLKDAGKRYLFLSNNSTDSPKDYMERLKRIGIDAVEDDLLTATQATLHYLKAHHPGKTFYVCGTTSLKEALINEGFHVTEDLDLVEGIVIGFDKELSYKRLVDISKLLSDKDLPYIATNPDYTCPVEFGFIPDCGSICEMLYHTTGRRPVVIGKPETLMPELAMERFGCKKTETAIVGDRLYTDILCGIHADICSILVLSGETTPEMLENTAYHPDFVLEDAGKILEVLNEN